MIKRSAIVTLLGIMLMGTQLCGDEKVNKSEIEKVFARGVYWPWECNKSSAAAAGKEYWQFVEGFMTDLKEKWHCNVIWFTNGPGIDEVPRVCALADKHGIYVLGHATPLGDFFYGGVAPKTKEVNAAAQKMIKQVNGSKKFGAYVLKDEPRRDEVEQVEYYRKVFAEADPKTPSIVVAMIHDAEAYVKKTGFTTLCIDPYMFAYDKSPNIPNPADSSRRSYRALVDGFNDMSREYDKNTWIMPQAFQDVWGPVWYDKNRNVVAEAGSYLHWRFPTEAELRWQIWEGVRAGSKGILFYVVLWQQAQSYDPATSTITEKARKTMADVKKNNWPITQKRFETNNPSSLTYADGLPVPQAQSVIKAYGQLQEIEALLLSLKISDLPYAFGTSPAAVQSFRKDGVNSEIYCVAVNDDFNQPRELELSLLPNVRKAINVISGAELAITPDINSRMQLAKIKLDAGDGAMLKLTLGEDAAGILLFSEDFSHACCSVKLENASRSQVFRPFNMGYHWCVRKDADKGKVNMDQQASITIDGLAGGKDQKTANVMSLVNAGKAMAFLKIDGHCPKPESIVVQFVGDSTGWNKTDNFNQPIEIPKGTKEIKILLNGIDAFVERIRIWSLPLEPSAK